MTSCSSFSRSAKARTHQGSFQRGRKANSGDPDTGGSQFFINLRDNTRLDWFCGDSESFHPVFGKVVAGYDEVVKKMEKVEISAEQPINPIKMISVSIEEKIMWNRPLQSNVAVSCIMFTASCRPVTFLGYVLGAPLPVVV